MTEKQDKTYTQKTKQVIMQQPINWGNIVDLLKEKYKIEETEEKIILEVLDVK